MTTKDAGHMLKKRARPSPNGKKRIIRNNLKKTFYSLVNRPGLYEAVRCINIVRTNLLIKQDHIGSDGRSKYTDSLNVNSLYPTYYFDCPD